MEGKDWRNGNHHSGDDVAMKVQLNESLWEMARKVYGSGNVPLGAICEENGLQPRIAVDGHGKRSFLPPVLETGETLYFPAPDRVKELSDEFNAGLKGGKLHDSFDQDFSAQKLSNPDSAGDSAMQHIGNSFQRFGDLLQTPVKAVVDTVLSAAEFASGLSDGVVSMDERAARTLHDTPLAGCADAVLGVAKFGAALQDGVCEMDQRIAKAIGCDLPSQTPAKSDKIAQRLQEPFVEHPLTRGQVEGTEHASRKPHTDYVEQPSSPRHAASAEHRTTHRHTAITEHPSPEPRFKESTMSQQALRMDEHSWLKSHDQEFPILEAAVRNKEHPSLKPRADVDPFPAVTAPDLPNNEYPSAKPPVQESPIVSDHLPSEEYPVWKGHLNKLPVYREVPLTDALQA